MDIKFPKNMFHSARLKLTLFYLAVLLVFSLTLTLGTRALALNAYRNSDITQRGEFHHLLLESFPFYYDEPPTDRPDSGIDQIQNQQEALVRQHLNEDLVFINLIALAVGGVVSYWFAGRTLGPIEESHETQKRFASDASHELRTPLTNLRVENEVFLRQKDFSSKEARELIESNLEEVQRLESLAGSLLSLAQYDGLNLEMSDVPIKEVIDGAINGVSKASGAKHIEFKTEIQSGLVRCQQHSLTQLLSIILDNAVKYGPDKSKVFVSGTAQGSEYKISVRDQGPGIDKADMPHIFERLYRGDKARSSRAGGYGLGLSLAKEIAKANDASITASNHSTGGAQFVISVNRA